MAADKSSILENAQLYTSKGQYDKAIAEWKKLTAGTAADGTVHNTIGDLHLKRNAPGEAIDAYFQAAAAFRKGDAALKAIALYKKILKVDPARFDAYRCLGDLNAERGLVGNAVADYLTLAKMYLKAGKSQEGMEVYRKIAALDPSNAEARQYLGDQADAGQSQSDSSGGAAQGQESQPAGGGPLRMGQGQGQGQGKEPQRTAEGASGASAGQGKGPQEYSRQGFLNEAIKLTTSGEYTEAESMLMEVLSREPGDPEVCRLLATLHLKRGELACAKAEFQFLAEAAMRAHDYVLAESMLLEYLKADPACVALCEILGRLYEQNGDAQSAVAQYGRALEVLQEHPDPEQPTLPRELYEKIVGLLPSSPLVGHYASVFASNAPPPSFQPHIEDVQAAPETAAPVPEVVAPPREEATRFAASPEPATSEASTADAEPASRGALAFKFAGASSEPASTMPVQPEPAKPAATAASSSFKFAASAEASASDQTSAGEQAAVPEQSLPAESPALSPPPHPTMTSEPGGAAADYGEHYQLGSAYQQMGLTEEAIQELEVSLNGTEWFVESCRLLAQCFKQQGRGQEAVSYLERAMADARAEGESGMLVRYDLGLLYEAEGYSEQALQVFSTIQSFRDVPERMAQLSRGDAPASEQEAGVVAVGHGGPEASPADRKKRRISYL